MTLEDLEPEPPAKCPDCGGSIYLHDRDDDGLCDECWEKKERVTQEQADREYRERMYGIRDRGIPL